VICTERRTYADPDGEDLDERGARPWDEARIHVLTHALHYGSGVFEGIRAYETARGAAVFRLTDHLRRLERSAKLYYMSLPYSVEELVQATKDVIAANGLNACYIRPLAYRGYGEMGLFPLKATVDCIVAVWPWGFSWATRHGTASVPKSRASRRPGTRSRACAKATGQYLNSILAKVEVVNAGYDEAIMLDDHGRVAEGSGENIFLVRDGVMYTPFPADGVLEGLTRDAVLRIAESEGIRAEERTLSRHDLVLADELFFTGRRSPIREVDDRRWQPAHHAASRALPPSPMATRSSGITWST
jgi:branched-chain amino acid aminotransferase